jgi:phosphoadenosine phosphosulfate reductase
MARHETAVAGSGADAPAELAAALGVRFAEQNALQILHAVLVEEIVGRAAVVSSFGAESAVLLALVAQVKRDAPVIFLETGKHFPETLRYRDELVARLGLSDVRSVRPDETDVAKRDPIGGLWARDSDDCCALRKVEPLERALAGFSAWITGRKRFQTEGRQRLGNVEADGRRMKINPLADLTREDIEAILAARGLPRHPLAAEGFASIGCMPCTSRVAPGEDERAGRWRGLDKTEFGIHWPAAAPQPRAA